MALIDRQTLAEICHVSPRMVTRWLTEGIIKAAHQEAGEATLYDVQAVIRGLRKHGVRVHIDTKGKLEALLNPR